MYTDQEKLDIVKQAMHQIENALEKAVEGDTSDCYKALLMVKLMSAGQKETM